MNEYFAYIIYQIAYEMHVHVRHYAYPYYAGMCGIKITCTEKQFFMF